MEDEPIEIEIKLDLVAAYIEMDDAEGAKELLDEVMKEGGTTQRKRAEALLAKMV
jgi:pilus assembly protein FimV